MKDTNRFNRTRLGDYIIYCDTCGAPCWKSQATLLKTETGLGGSLVCPRDRDIVDYGLVPYKIRAEQSVPIARINNFNDNANIPQTENPITNYNNTNIMNWPVTTSDRNPARIWDTSGEVWNTSTQTWDDA